MANIVNSYRHATGASNGLLNNLQAYYKFEESSGTIYDAHGSNDGTVTGATYSATGKNGNCLSYDGSGDYVNVGTSMNFYGTSSSISIWFNLTALPSSGNWTTLFANGKSDTAVHYYVDMYNNAGTQQIRFGTYNLVGGNIYSYYNHSLSTGTWYNIICVHDGTNWDMYINNTLSYTGGVTGATYNNSLNNTIGSNYITAGYVRSFNGKLDEIAIAFEAWDSDKRATIYNSGAGTFYDDFTS